MSANENTFPITGAQRTIDCATDASGEQPAFDFLASAECPAKDRARLVHWFRVIAEHTERKGTEEAFKFERDGLWAFKSYQARVLAFQVGRTWWLTHGFVKKKDKIPPAEFERAARIQAEHMKRGGGR